jgi:hypothetical protein
MPAAATGRRAAGALLCVACALGAHPVRAAADTGDQSASPYLDDRFAVSFGSYFIETKLKLDLKGNAAGSDQPVDVSHDFNRNVNFNRVRADALWRINPRHHVRFMWFGNRVDRSRILDRDLAWGDYTFQANATLNAHTTLGVYELSYEYAFLRRPTFELAAGAGIHTMDISIRLSGQATITDANGNTSAAGFSTSSSHLPAPLPVAGVHATWAATPRLLIEPSAQLFKVNVDGFSGHWTDLRLVANWMFTRHFGIGAGYDRFDVNVDVAKAKFNGSLKTGYSGYQAMLVGSW